MSPMYNPVKGTTPSRTNKKNKDKVLISIFYSDIKLRSLILTYGANYHFTDSFNTKYSFSFLSIKFDNKIVFFCLYC